MKVRWLNGDTDELKKLLNDLWVLGVLSNGELTAAEESLKSYEWMEDRELDKEARK